MARRSGASSASTVVAVVIIIVVVVVAAVVAVVPLLASSSVTVSRANSSSLASTPPTSDTSVSTSSLASPADGRGGPLITYSADAYAAEVTSLLNGFGTSSGARVAPAKSGGSFADANAIAAGAPDDVFVSVALSATSSQYLKNLSSNWAIGFASDQMVLAYSTRDASQTPAARNVIDLATMASSSNSTSDWGAFYTALASGGGVKVGISNPLSDPAGLRAWLVLEAAGYLYAEGNRNAYVDLMLRDDGNVSGTSAAALVAPLQAGQIQLLFIYRSAAVSDGLSFVTLDSHVNLGSPSLGPFYSKFSYTDSAGETRGGPIVLCITVPLGALNASEALRFVQYVVQNAKSLSSYGLQPLPVALLYEDAAPPAPIQGMVTQGLVTVAGPLH